MQPEDGKKEGSGKGFAGLSGLVTDVDAAISDAGKSSPKAPVPSPTTERSAPASSAGQQKSKTASHPYQTPQQTSLNSSAGMWLLGMCAVIGVIWLVSLADSNRPSPTPSYAPQVSGTENWPEQPPQVAAPSRPLESMPPVGRGNVLDAAQIRYCLAEDMRIQAANGAVDTYNGSQVDQFNGMVADYNSRCSEFRYRVGVLESARSEIEPYRLQIQSEGEARFHSVRSAVNPQAAPNEMVLAIQSRLNELGYDVGSADGYSDDRTSEAIASFQQDHDLEIDGLPSESLFMEMQNASPKVSSPGDPESNSPAQAVTTVNSGAPAAVALPSPGMTPAPGDATSPKNLAGVPRKGLYLKFKGTSWVEVRDVAHDVIHTSIALADSELTIDGKPPLTLTLGDAAAAEVWYNGERVSLDRYARAGVARIIVGQGAR